MANKKKSGAPSPGGRGGNVVVDLGEEVDGMIHHAFKTGYAPKGSKGLGAVRRPTGFRPSFLSNSGFGFRPSFHRSQLGLAVGLPSTVDPMRTLGGAFAGVAANRVLYRLIPWVGEKLKVGISGARTVSEEACTSLVTVGKANVLLLFLLKLPLCRIVPTTWRPSIPISSAISRLDFPSP